MVPPTPPASTSPLIKWGGSWGGPRRGRLLARTALTPDCWRTVQTSSVEYSCTSSTWASVWKESNSCGKHCVWFLYLRLHTPGSPTTSGQWLWPLTWCRPWRGSFSPTFVTWWTARWTTLLIDLVLVWMPLSSTCCTDHFHTWRAPGALWDSCFLTSPMQHNPPITAKGEAERCRSRLPPGCMDHRLPHRPQYVRLCDCVSDVVVCSMGASQGTVLSPFLFTLYISDFGYNAAATSRSSPTTQPSLHVWKRERSGVQEVHHQLCRLVWIEPPAHQHQQDKEGGDWFQE